MQYTLKEHPTYTGYFLSTDGRLFSNKKTPQPKELKPFVEKNGYRSHYIYYKGKPVFQRIHQLVADTFLPKPEGFESEYNVIHHKNLDKTDSSVSNLQRCKNRSEHTRLHHQLKKQNKEEVL